MNIPILYGRRPIGLGIESDTIAQLLGTLVQVSNGWIVTIDPNDSSLSVQPNGDFQTRTFGTAGAYEVCQRHPKLNALVYTPSAPGQPTMTYLVFYREL